MDNSNEQIELAMGKLGAQINNLTNAIASIESQFALIRTMMSDKEAGQNLKKENEHFNRWIKNPTFNANNRRLLKEQGWKIIEKNYKYEMISNIVAMGRLDGTDEEMDFREKVKFIQGILLQIGRNRMNEEYRRIHRCRRAPNRNEVSDEEMAHACASYIIQEAIELGDNDGHAK